MCYVFKVKELKLLEDLLCYSDIGVSMVENFG